MERHVRTGPLGPIPSHLAVFPWYAKHQAWLAEQGYRWHHDVPEGVRPARADLTGADLTGSDLLGARLVRARLVGASLARARLDYARLDCANLLGASLFDASLAYATLVGARLAYARLTYARLNGAHLDDAVFDDAYLDPIRDDVWAVLATAPREAPAVLAALREGSVECSLVGTIAKARGCDYRELGIRPDADRPAEVWFAAIRRGNTPETSQVARIAAQWVRERIEAHGAQ